MKALIVLFLCAMGLISSTAFATGGHLIGNGGLGVYRNGELKLLELADLPDKWMDNDVFEKIHSKDPELYFLLMDVLKQLEWQLVDRRLVRSLDVDWKTMGKEVVQIAHRSFGRVLIQQSLWEQLSPSHRSWLLIHEALGALTVPRRYFYNAYFQNGKEVQTLVRRLYEATHYPNRMTEFWSLLKESMAWDAWEAQLNYKALNASHIIITLQMGDQRHDEVFDIRNWSEEDLLRFRKKVCKKIRTIGRLAHQDTPARVFMRLGLTRFAVDIKSYLNFPLESTEYYHLTEAENDAHPFRAISLLNWNCEESLIRPLVVFRNFHMQDDKNPL